eukprot:TRINITY_DN22271_c0_g1_i1.p1 TRINITY_DN22271_c0_g1~~TRINITY_DN22271_c0_g1_i1.p1  ORF type:complete len:600 (-),score=42.08 TRINITY_DN22271_c0_g1_i1:196-1995(-)
MSGYNPYANAARMLGAPTNQSTSFQGRLDYLENELNQYRMQYRSGMANQQSPDVLRTPASASAGNGRPLSGLEAQDLLAAHTQLASAHADLLRHCMASGSGLGPVSANGSLSSPHLADGCPMVMITCGPVIGTVTQDSANVLLEVDEDCMMTCVATPSGGGKEVVDKRMFKKNLPGVFRLQNLLPGTPYTVTFSPLAPPQKLEIMHRGCSFRTMPLAEQTRRLRVIALSCDYPDRLGRGNENPWDGVAKICAEGECDVMLHLGDQVYTKARNATTAAMRVMKSLNLSAADVSANLREKMHNRASHYLQESYRATWAGTSVAKAMANTSHLMIWSDNDVSNDFTVLRNSDGTQYYLKDYLQVAMGVYRMYQRQLWDPSCYDGTEQDLLRCRTLGYEKDEVQEWHFHQYGPFGIFMIDMRGNRINPNGEIKDGPIMSEAQRKALQDAFATPGLRCMLIGAEIPFVGDPPDEIKEKAKKFVFLKDHWPYELDELQWLLDLCFAFKKTAGNEVVLLAGDIHVSVDSVITEVATGQSVRCITTSPITNEARKFYPPLSGRIGERYAYTHKPYPGQRTYCTLDLRFENGKATVDANMVCVPFVQN